MCYCQYYKENWYQRVYVDVYARVRDEVSDKRLNN